MSVFLTHINRCASEDIDSSGGVVRIIVTLAVCGFSSVNHVALIQWHYMDYYFLKNLHLCLSEERKKVINIRDGLRPSKL